MFTNKVTTLTANIVLTEKDLGTVFVLPAAGKTIGIPDASAMEDGGTLEFVVSTIVSNDWFLTSASNDIIGIADATTADDDGPETSTGVNEVKFIASGSVAKPGAWFKLTVVGDIWHFSGMCEVAEALTIA